MKIVRLLIASLEKRLCYSIAKNQQFLLALIRTSKLRFCEFITINASKTCQIAFENSSIYMNSSIKIRRRKWSLNRLSDIWILTIKTRRKRIINQWNIVLIIVYLQCNVANKAKTNVSSNVKLWLITMIMI